MGGQFCLEPEYGADLTLLQHMRVCLILSRSIGAYQILSKRREHIRVYWEHIGAYINHGKRIRGYWSAYLSISECIGSISERI